MHTIEIDFDVFKKLTVLRETEVVSYNDVLRRVLGMGSALSKVTPTNFIQSPGSQNTTGSWTTKAVTFPVGTEFRASHKGQPIYGRVEAGALVVSGKRFLSPSAAAVSITGNPVNGWMFWECKKPGAPSWQILKSFRK